MYCFLLGTVKLGNIFEKAKKPYIFVENNCDMKSLINYFRTLREQHLRERCVKYAIKAHEGKEKGFTVSISAQDIELYIKEGQTFQERMHQKGFLSYSKHEDSF